MAEHAHHWIVGEHALQLLRGQWRAVGNNNLARVLAETNSNSAAVMETCPTGAACNVHRKVQQWPIAHGVGAIKHGFCLAIWTGNTAAIKMVAANHNWGFHLAICHHFVEAKPGLGALAQTQPANARGQTLESHALLRHVNPARQRFVLRK